jgi:hypothetical protein
MASFTGCEKSWSSSRPGQEFSARRGYLNHAARLRIWLDSCAGSTLDSLSSRTHSRISDARPLGECLRSRVAFHDGHIASSRS